MMENGSGSLGAQSLWGMHHLRSDCILCLEKNIIRKYIASLFWVALGEPLRGLSKSRLHLLSCLKCNCQWRIETDSVQQSSPAVVNILVFFFPRIDGWGNFGCTCYCFSNPVNYLHGELVSRVVFTSSMMFTFSSCCVAASSVSRMRWSSLIS